MSVLATLKWVNHTESIMKYQNILHSAENPETDTVIACQGRIFCVHKIILVNNSDFFKDILTIQPDHIDPVIILPDVDPTDMESLITYLYTGQAVVDTVNVVAFLDMCRSLQIKGLMENVSPEITFKGPEEEVKGEVTIMDEHFSEEEEVIIEDEDEEIPQVEEEYEDDIEIIVESDKMDSELDSSDKQDSTTEKRGQENFEDTAAEAIDKLLTGMSLKECSQMFNISKTALWRRAKKLDAYKTTRKKVNRCDAEEAMLRGEKLSKISKKYKVPLATLYRDKMRLINEGKIGHGKRAKGDVSINMDLAIEACLTEKLTQSEAAKKYCVSKTTLWRKMKRIPQKDVKDYVS